MQTYVHLGVGVLAAQAIFPDNLSQSQFLVVGASLVPDVPVMVKYGWDLLCGKPPMKEQGKKFLLIQEIINSHIIWLFTLFWLPVFIGFYSHIILDRMSHKDERFAATDPSWFWPVPRRWLPWWLRTGLFEGRKDHGKLWDPLQIVLTGFCICIAVWL